MNKVILFLIGAGSGALVSHFVTKRVLEARTDARIEEEIRRYKAAIERRNEVSERVKKASEGSETSPKTISSTSLDGGPVDVKRRDYHKISESYVKPQPDELFDGDPVENEHPEDDNPEYEIISGTEIDSLDPDRITYLLWDVENNVLKDEYGDEIEERELLVGDILDDILSEHPEGLVSDNIEHTIYIANHRIDAYYEVDVVTEPGAAEPIND